MRKSSMITRAAGFLLSAVIAMAMAGCGTQGQPVRFENETDLS